MVGAGGLEPLTSSVSGRRSNQLSYAPTRGAAQRSASNGVMAASSGRKANEKYSVRINARPRVRCGAGRRCEVARLVDGALERLAGDEAHGLPLGDLDRGAGLRIARGARLAIRMS